MLSPTVKHLLITSPNLAPIIAATSKGPQIVSKANPKTIKDISCYMDLGATDHVTAQVD